MAAGIVRVQVRWGPVFTAERAERAGLELLGGIDHLLRELEEGPHGFWECTILVAALAAATSRIRPTTTVAVPLEPPSHASHYDEVARHWRRHGRVDRVRAASP